ncbi:hypothetical protein D3C74_489390 [compost metagenome]
MNFRLSSGCFFRKAVVSDADPPNHGAMGSPSTYLAITPVSSTRVVPFRRPTVPVGSNV